MEEIEIMLRCILVTVACLFGSTIVYHIFAISEIIERRFEKRRRQKVLSFVLSEVRKEERTNQDIPDVFAEFEKTMDEKDEKDEKDEEDEEYEAEWKKHFRDRWEKRE